MKYTRKMATDAFVLYGRYLRSEEMPSKEDENTISKVCATLTNLRFNGNNDIIECVENVYFKLPKKYCKGMIDSAVTNYSIKAYMSRATVYRKLKKARDLYINISIVADNGLKMTIETKRS